MSDADNSPRTNNDSQPVMDTRISFANEIKALYGAYTMTGQPWALESIKKILDKLEPELKNHPLPHNTALHKLADDPCKAFDTNEAQQLVQEVLCKGLRPETVAMVTPEKVQLLSAGMKKLNESDTKGFSIPYKHIVGFVATCCFWMEKDGLRTMPNEGDEDYHSAIAQAASIAKMGASLNDDMVAIENSKSSVFEDNQKVTLATVRDKLQEAMNAPFHFTREQIDATDDEEIRSALPADIWQKYGDILTTNDVKLCLMAMADQEAERTKDINDLTKKTLADMVALIDKVLGDKEGE